MTQSLAVLPDREERRGLLVSLVGQFGAVLAGREPAEVATMLQRVGLRVYVEEGAVTRIRLE